jgi:hypothetical protein
MLVANSNQSITAVLSGAFTTTAPSYVVKYKDRSGKYSTYGSVATTPGATIVPGAGDSLEVEEIIITNCDTAAATVTLNLVVSGTSYPMPAITLAVGDVLHYVIDQGFKVIDSNGRNKSSSNLNSSFSGATGTNLISMPDNLADALSVIDGATEYLTFTTTTASPLITAKEPFTVTGRMTAQLLAAGPKATDTYSSAMTIDVTKSLHVIAASNGTSATSTFTPSAAGTAGDILTIHTEADSGGTVTVTFASTFHSSGTQATTASHFSTITFQSDGTRWNEICRTTALS